MRRDYELALDCFNKADGCSDICLKIEAIIITKNAEADLAALENNYKLN
jgi:hypothetical protein